MCEGGSVPFKCGAAWLRCGVAPPRRGLCRAVQPLPSRSGGGSLPGAHRSRTVGVVQEDARSVSCRALLRVWALPADFVLSAGYAAAHVAGHLERVACATLELELHDQHQLGDELLARGCGEPLEPHRAAPGSSFSGGFCEPTLGRVQSLFGFHLARRLFQLEMHCR